MTVMQPVVAAVATLAAFAMLAIVDVVIDGPGSGVQVALRLCAAGLALAALCLTWLLPRLRPWLKFVLGAMMWVFLLLEVYTDHAAELSGDIHYRDDFGHAQRGLLTIMLLLFVSSSVLRLGLSANLVLSVTVWLAYLIAGLAIDSPGFLSIRVLLLTAACLVSVWTSATVLPLQESTVSLLAKTAATPHHRVARDWNFILDKLHVLHNSELNQDQADLLDEVLAKLRKSEQEYQTGVAAAVETDEALDADTRNWLLFGPVGAARGVAMLGNGGERRSSIVFGAGGGRKARLSAPLPLAHSASRGSLLSGRPESPQRSPQRSPHRSPHRSIHQDGQRRLQPPSKITVGPPPIMHSSQTADKSMSSGAPDDDMAGAGAGAGTGAGAGAGAGTAPAAASTAASSPAAAAAASAPASASSASAPASAGAPSATPSTHAAIVNASLPTIPSSGAMSGGAGSAVSSLGQASAEAGARKTYLSRESLEVTSLQSVGSFGHRSVPSGDGPDNAPRGSELRDSPLVPGSAPVRGAPGSRIGGGVEHLDNAMPTPPGSIPDRLIDQGGGIMQRASRPRRSDPGLLRPVRRGQLPSLLSAHTLGSRLSEMSSPASSLAKRVPTLGDASDELERSSITSRGFSTIPPPDEPCSCTAASAGGGGCHTPATASAEDAHVVDGDDMSALELRPAPASCKITDFVDLSTFNADMLGWETRCRRPLLSTTITVLPHVMELTEADTEDPWPGPPPAVLNAFFEVIDTGYVAQNPYHNATHAASVVWDVQYYLLACGLARRVGKLDRFSAVTAAAIHDFQHPGVNNAFIINSHHPLALQHNDDAPLERFHVASAFQVMRRPGCNLLATLKPDDYKYVRASIITMVLATDVSRHIALVGTINAAAQRKPDSAQGARPPPHSNPPAEFDVSLSLASIVVLADLGHAAKAFELHKQWTLRISEEFFRQGDKELEIGLPVSPLCNRANANIARSQLGFFQYLVLPLFRAVGNAPNVIPLARKRFRRRVTEAEGNLAEWKRLSLPTPREGTPPPASESKTTPTTTGTTTPAAAAQAASATAPSPATTAEAGDTPTTTGPSAV